MKYLLSILVLFSGLSFADDSKFETYNTFLICDTSYIFSPSIEERLLFGFKDNSSYSKASMFYYSPSLELQEAYNVSVVVFPPIIQFSEDLTGRYAGYTREYMLDERTLNMSNGRKCKKISKEEFIEATK